MYIVNTTLTVQQNLIAMINVGSSVAFTGTEFDVGLPIAHTYDPLDDTNTSITITAKAESPSYSGSVVTRYKRLTLGQTRLGLSNSWYVDSSKTREQLITDIINNHKLLSSDVTFTGLEGSMPAAGQSDTLTITAIANSYFYEGSFNITVHNTDPV